MLLTDFIRRNRLRGLLRKSPGFFDADFYLRNNLYLLQSKLTPLEHYIRYGSRQNLRPNGVFDVDYYRNQVPSLKPGRDAASHYLTQGWKKSLSPAALFDAPYYLKHHPDVVALGEEPLSHYLRTGWTLGYNPHPLFDVEHYRYAYEDIADREPLTHYLTDGAREARRPNAMFKPDHYIVSRVGEAVKVEDALLHFQRNASAETLSYYNLTDKIRLKGPVGKIYDYARANGLQIVEFPHEADYSWPTPNVINRKIERPPIHTVLPKPYVAILNDVIAFPGTRLLLAGDGKILHDELGEDWAPQYHDKLKAIGSCKDGTCIISAVKVQETLDSALLISSDADFNYFHMLLETLPKLTLAEQANCPSDVPILLQESLHPNILATVERVAKGRRIIYLPWGAGIAVKNLWYVSDMSRVMNPVADRIDVSHDIVLSPVAVRDISQRILPDRNSRRGNRKIYLARTSHYRLLNNQPALIELLKAKGFEIVDTAKMNLQEQIDLMDGVGTIMAPTGAALTNLLWCAEDTKVLILVADHPQMNLNIFNHIGNPLGVSVEFCLCERMHEMAGEHSVHDNFEVDLNVISDWCDRNGSGAG